MGDLHRVRRWRWHARTPDATTALALRRLLRDQHEVCEAALERTGASLVPAGQVWHVPRLELSVRLADRGELDAARFAERLEAALRVALAELAPVQQRRSDAGEGVRDAPPRAGRAGAVLPVARGSRAAAALDGLRHYLVTGMLPWTLAGLAGEAAHEALVEAAVSAAGAVGRGERPLAAVLPVGSDAVRIGALLRWLALLPPVVRQTWLAAQAPDTRLPEAVAAAWRRWLDDGTDDRLEWQALWLAQPLAPATLRARIVAARAQTPKAPPFVDVLADALDALELTPPSRGAKPSRARAPAASADASPPQRTVDAAPEAHFVSLAGLVLLHPWLPRLLGACGVLDASGKQIEASSRPKALALLHALACGAVAPVEHELPFAKLLLGGRPDEPLDVPLPRPSADDQAEIDALLAAVREHWSALRGTGVEGLRLSFLQRRGLLARDDTGWRLRMEAEPFDLLLATLPWSIGLVRLPWMVQPLTVEWPTP